MAGTEINNGGAGISINGKVATFYSAQMQVNPVPLKTSSTMTILTGLIKKLNIPNNATIELSENVIPSFDRTYYAVTEESIDPETLRTIKEEYSRVTKTSVENITIFALTDPQSKITLLLPDYFKLNENEQVAILFHESLWINKRVKNYENMLEIEKDTQIYSMYPHDCTPRYNLIKRIEAIFNEKTWALNSIFRCETEKYHVYTNAGSVPFYDFFNSTEMGTFAQITLTSFFNNHSDINLIDLLLSQINDQNNFKTFLGSKRALVEALKDQDMSMSILITGSPLAFDSKNPTSQYNTDILTQEFDNNQIIYGFLNYNYFELTLSSHLTSRNIKIILSRNSRNKNE